MPSEEPRKGRPPKADRNPPFSGMGAGGSRVRNGLASSLAWFLSLIQQVLSKPPTEFSDDVALIHEVAAKLAHRRRFLADTSTDSAFN